MRAPTYAARGALSFNMTPMIDIVFLLIIFFIVSSHLARQETQLELALPLAASGQPPGDDDTRRLIINVSADGQMQLGGTPVELEQLRRKIDFEAERAGRDLEVRIRGDRNVPYRVVEPIMVACARAGVWKVSFAVVERE
jgi:biopolymer transport protein ExbD